MSRAWSRVGSLIVALCVVQAAPVAWAGWRVIPARVELLPGAKSSNIKVVNDGTEPVRFSVSARSWTQDEAGKDVYEPTDDVVFFPRILIVPGGEERIIRAGLKVPRQESEVTYRLFIEQIPEKKPDSSTAVNLAIRFGAPIFAKPLEPKPSGAIQDLRVEDGEVRFTLSNTGNVHLQPTQIQARGFAGGEQPVLEHEVEPWYLLAGKTRAYTIALDERCGSATSMQVSVVSEDVTLEERITFDAAACP